jgi:hypothetical protein
LNLNNYKMNQKQVEQVLKDFPARIKDENARILALSKAFMTIGKVHQSMLICRITATRQREGIECAGSGFSGDRPHEGDPRLELPPALLGVPGHPEAGGRRAEQQGHTH